jgi:hypothetical protein
MQHGPEGMPFNNYYNAINGQFIRLGAKWLYAFGDFGHKENRHRILSFDLACG